MYVLFQRGASRWAGHTTLHMQHEHTLFIPTSLSPVALLPVRTAGWWLLRWRQSDSRGGMCVSATCLFSYMLHTHGDRCSAAGGYVALNEALVNVGIKLSAVPCCTAGGRVVAGWYMGCCIGSDTPSHTVMEHELCRLSAASTDDDTACGHI